MSFTRCYTTDMIRMIRGAIISLTDRSVVIDTGGIGYEVFIAPELLSSIKIGSDIELWTYMAVRETSMGLFGFQNSGDLGFFELLLDVSGIGPRSALGIIGIAPTATLKSAIASGDTSYLTKVSGIGKKMAEKIVIELRDKLEAAGQDSSGKGLQEESDALEALTALGYTGNEARTALQKIQSKDIPTEDRVKQALQILSNNN